MSFVSWQYLVLLAGVFCLYWRLPQGGRVRLLLGTSYFFYAFWDARFLALIIASTVLDYFCGQGAAGRRPRAGHFVIASSLPALWLLLCRFSTPQPWVSTSAVILALCLPCVVAGLAPWINRRPDRQRRKQFLITSIAGNLLALGFFKYCGFFADSLRELAAMLGWTPGWVLPAIILPVGISFYTFQSLSYTIDIYRGKMAPAESLETFAAYVAFFPQLVAGPIERAGRLLPQLETLAPWSWATVRTGGVLLLTGYFKKVFVGDNCGLIANHAFQAGNQLNGWWALLGVAAFAFQIYGDFGGYSDIARGSARLLGIELSQNFRFPYAARSPSDFWQRWHITLSTWFRDYVYIPLGGNRGGPDATLRNLLLTMLVAGLWHGAGWMYLLWGLYHGILLALYHRFHIRDNVVAMFGFTLIGWAIFRCENLDHLLAWVAGFLFWSDVGIGDPLRAGGWLAIHVLPLLLIQRFTRRNCDEADLAHLSTWARGVWLFILLLLVATSTNLQPEFIYFQF